MDFKKMIKKYEEDIINNTCEFIKIRSVEGDPQKDMPFGKEVDDALNFVLNLCEELGFNTKNLDGRVGYAEVGCGEEMLGIMVHVDVVKEGNGWSYPPFRGEIHEGKIYGRGSVDDKGPTIAVIYALKILKDLGFEFNKKVRIIFGTNEETSWKGINYYVENEIIPQMSFTPDGNFPVIQGEKGILGFTLTKKFENDVKCNLIKKISGGTSANVVPDRCIAELDTSNISEEEIIKIIEVDERLSFEIEQGQMVVTSFGKSAHASQPYEGDNAISIMMRFLEKILNKDDGISSFVSTYNQLIGLDYNGEKIVGKFEDDISGKLTFNVGKIHVDEHKAQLGIDIRYPIKSTYRQIKTCILNNIDEYGWKYSEDEHFAPIYLESNHFMIESLMKVYKDQTGDTESKPIIIGGGTYARAMENAVAFGPVFPNEEELAHKANEYISIDKLLKLTEIYSEAIRQLCK